MDRKTVGILGEVSAARFYRDAGYTLLASNYRTRQGEIDLIVQGRGILVFTEVKTRAEGNSYNSYNSFTKNESVGSFGCPLNPSSTPSSA